MTNHRFTRSELLLGAGTATLAGLAGCVDRAASPFISGATAGVSPLRIGSPTVAVSDPTGAAIQAAIDRLGPSGGTIHLTANAPYVIGNALVIAKNNIKLVGRGPRVTKLVAKSGAILTVPGHSEEYLLLVQGATNTSISELLVDTVNQANSAGNPRRGIGAWDSTEVKVTGVTCINNLGPNGYNQGLSFNRCTQLTVDQCEVSQSRTGISVWKSTNFRLSTSEVKGCQAEGPNYPSPNSAISIVSSSSGVILSCFLTGNAVNRGIFVSDGASLQIATSKIYKTLAFPTRPENDGIVIESSSGPRITVDRCDIQQNSGSGISASGSSNVTITECTIMNNGTSPRFGSGVSVNGGTKDIHVTGNHISDRRGVSNPGIKAGDASSLDSGGQVTNNTVLGFGAGVALGANSTEFVVEKNDLRKNTTCVTNDGTGNRVTDNLC